jgi:uncharacterized protein (TIGR02268 family)
VLLLTLLVGTAAQPFPPARVQQQRDVTLSATSDAPVQEVYVAPGVLTTLVFPMPLERASLVVDEQGTHFALVDVGDRTLTLEPRGEWTPQKRLSLKARLQDGTPVALVLRVHPSQVDGRVNVKRPRSLESLEAELTALQARCGESGPMGLLHAGQLDGKGVLARRIDVLAQPKTKTGLMVVDGMGYRAAQWALVEVKVKNLPGQAPWVPLQTRLIGPDGRAVKVVAVWTEKPRLAPGEAGRVRMQTEAPSWREGAVLQLEIQDGGGRLLSITHVTL